MSIAKKSFSIIVRDILLFGINILVSIILARKLGPKLLAEYFILVLITVLADTLFRYKFEIAYVYFGNKDNTNKEIEYITTINVFTFLSTILFFLILYFLSNILFNFWNVSGNINLIIFSIFLQVYFSFFYTNYSYFHIKTENISVYNYMLLLKATIFFILILFLFIFNKITILNVFNINTLAIIISLSYGIYRLGYKIFSIKYFNCSLLKKMFRYKSNIYFISLLTQLNSLFFKSFLPKYLSKESYSFINISLDRIVLMNKVPDSLNVVLFPKLSISNDLNINNELIIKSIRISFLILSTLFLCIIPFLNFVIIKFYGIEYINVTKVLFILFPGYLIYTLSTISNQFFMTSGKSEVLLKTLIFFNLLQITIFFILKNNLNFIISIIFISSSYLLLGTINITKFVLFNEINPRKLIPNFSDLFYIFNKFKSLI